MKAAVVNEEGQLQTMLMGCYGLGISRVVAAAIEQHHDKDGIVWPQNIAPFQLVIIPINGHRSPTVKEAAENLYQQFTKNGQKAAAITLKPTTRTALLTLLEAPRNF